MSPLLSQCARSAQGVRRECAGSAQECAGSVQGVRRECAGSAQGYTFGQNLHIFYKFHEFQQKYKKSTKTCQNNVEILKSSRKPTNSPKRMTIHKNSPKNLLNTHKHIKTHFETPQTNKTTHERTQNHSGTVQTARTHKNTQKYNKKIRKTMQSNSFQNTPNTQKHSNSHNIHSKTFKHAQNTNTHQTPPTTLKNIQYDSNITPNVP